MRGIAAVGTHLPRARVEGETVAEAWDRFDGPGIDAKRVPGVDEDALTMAVAAARDALARGAVDADDVSAVSLATTTPPLDEEEVLPRLVRMLDLPRTVETRTFTQSTRAGAPALEAALEAPGPALAVASDAPRGDPAGSDHPLGGGAAAFLVTDDPAAAHVETATFADDLPGVRYRERDRDAVEGLEITTYQREGIRRCVTEAVSGLSVDLESVAAAAVHQPDGRLPSRITRDLALDATAVERGTVVGEVGDAGAAGVPLGLAAGLSSGGDEAAAEGDGLTLAVFFGSGGGATAMLFEGGLDREPALPAAGRDLNYPEYLRARGYVGEADVAGGGAHVSLPSWQRTIDQRYRLVAGRCPNCEALAFPPEGACPNCHRTGDFEPVSLPREGTVAASTVIGHGGAPPEFAEHQRRAGAYGAVIVELEADGGGSVTVPGQLTDADPEAVAVGDEVRAVLRRIYEEEGLPRYGVKFVPADA